MEHPSGIGPGRGYPDQQFYETGAPNRRADFATAGRQRSSTGLSLGVMCEHMAIRLPKA
jgi:hypothetical protein